MKKLADLPAFPRAAFESDDVTVNMEQDGMTYRHWLAGLAMQGILGCPSENQMDDPRDWNFDHLATAAALAADALIAELERKPEA